MHCGQKTLGLPPPATPTKAPPQTWYKTGTSNLGLGKVPSFPPSAEVTVHPSLSDQHRGGFSSLPGPGVFRLCSWEARGVRGPGMN